MDARFYNSEEIDIQQLASDLVNAYIVQGYQAQQFGNKDQMLVQLKKGGDFEAILGMQAALSVTLQRTTGGVLAMIGQQKWLDKAAVGAVGIVALPVLWPLALTAGVGAIRQASLGNQALNMVDGLVRQQRPSIAASAVPYQLLPQVQQQWASPSHSPIPTYTPPGQVTVTPVPMVPSLPAPTPVRDSTPPPTPKGLRCSHCNTPHEEDDTFCSGCGRSLIAPKLYCSKCNSEVKQGASFCPKCGASTFHTLAAVQARQQPQPAPVPPTPSVTYAPPQPAQPVYTPPTPAPPAYTPPQPAPPAYTPPQPAQPVYTPPQPATPAYTPPPTPVYTPPTAQTPVYTPPPTVEQYAPPTEAAPVEPAYVPPATQAPPVAPQPKVTLVPGSQPSKQSITPPPPRPQKVYYTPSSQAQATPAVEQSQPTITQVASSDTTLTAPIQPLTAKPSAQPTFDPNVPWGRLTFDNGTQVQLTGERVVVGRYDHDLGGLQPEVDLAKMEGADTISRVHASIEHVGSAYMLTDLNSTNATRLNAKRVEPDKATRLNDGDKLTFGKVAATFNKL